MTIRAENEMTLVRVDDGEEGADGTTFYPSVSSEGVISWTNDGEKPNPEPVVIKGPQGISLNSVTRYYKLSDTTPTDYPPSTGWQTSEPAYTPGDARNLYICDLFAWSNSTVTASEISLSSSYEAAKQAYNAAQGALTAANGKNTIFHQSTQPTGGTYKVGDTWFDTDDGYKMYTYNGSAWVAEQLGANAIADLAITNAKIANGTIQNAKIATVDAGKITTGTIDANRIAANSLTIGKIATADQEQILNSNVQVGARNWLQKTGDLSQWYHNTTYVTDDDFNGSEVNFRHGSTLSWNYAIGHNEENLVFKYADVKDKTFTLSFEAKSDAISTGAAERMHIALAGCATAGGARTKYGIIGNIYNNLISTEHLNTTYTKYSVTFTINDAFFTAGSGDVNYVFVQFYNYTLSNVSVRNVKMELGNKATDWTPAPEDVQQYTDDKVANLNSSVFNQLTDTTQTAYSLDAESGAKLATVQKYGGKSLVFNQLNNNSFGSQTINGVTFTKNDDGSWTLNGTATANTSKSLGNALAVLPNHKYFICKINDNENRVRAGGGNTAKLVNTWSTAIISAGTAADGSVTNFNIGVNAGQTFNNYKIFAWITDLTQMFGAGNEPTTVEEVKALLPNDYYAYNTGEVIHAEVDKVVEQGRNIAKVEDITFNVYGVTIKITNGHLSVSGTNTGGVTQGLINSTYNVETYNLIKELLKTNSVYIQGATSRTNINYMVKTFVNGAGKWVNINNGYVIPQGEEFSSVYVQSNTAGVVNELEADIFICVGSTSAPYSPYHKVEYPIPQTIRNLDGYGWSAGSVYNEVDFERKKFIKRVGRVDLGSLSWSRLTTSQGNYRFYSAGISTIAKHPSSTSEYANIFCSLLPVGNNNSANNEIESIAIQTNGNISVYKVSLNNATATQFKTAMNGVYLYYELATPVETDISDIPETFPVEAGGTVTFHNSNGDDYRIPIESKLMWYDSSLESRAKADSENASKTATNYIVADSSGLHVTDNTNNVGTSNENAVRIDSDSVDIIKAGQKVAEYSQGLTVWSDNGTGIAHLGYGTTEGASGQTASPYYDLGIRKSGTTIGSYSVAEGGTTTASSLCSHAEGRNTVASGWYAHAEGNLTTASGSDSHAEGYSTTASGPDCHAEGDHTTASGSRSHAEGYHTTASGYESHAEGEYTTASGSRSHAEGNHTTARGDYSHAEGYYTIASSIYQHVQGKYNVKDSDNIYADIVGNGTDENHRSNAYALDWDGNAYYNGEVYVGCNADSTGRTLSLGTYVTSAILTSDSGTLYFSIPLGRVFPSGTTVSKITFNIIARASNANGTGYYIIKNSSGGSDNTPFDSSASTVCTFYNASNTKRTPSVKPTLSIQGGTNLYFSWATGTSHYFSGTSTITGYINNNAVTVSLSNIQITLNVPSQS